MARISFPDRGLGEHVDWALLRTDMAVGMGALSDAVYGNTQLPLREREAARMHAAFADDELADLTICCGMFLGLGRTLAVIGVRAPDERILI